MEGVSSRTKRAVREFFRDPVDASLPWEVIQAAVSNSPNLALANPEDLTDFGSEPLCLVDFHNGELDTVPTLAEGGEPC